MGAEPILILERMEITVQIITNTKQIIYEQEEDYKPFHKTISNFLNWYYKGVQKNEDNQIINTPENKTRFIRGLKNYFNININGDDLN